MRNTNNHRIRVLVVDDSALMRKKISEMINADPGCEVIATARNGEEAIKGVSSLVPDVVTLDLALPRMDGLTALAYIMCEWPTPVVVVSAHPEMTMRALEMGAVDFVKKPGREISRDIEMVCDMLIEKIRIAARVSVKKIEMLLPTPAHVLAKKPPKSLNKVIAIGSSTGGPRALAEIIPQFPPDIPAGILITQHMPQGFTKAMAERLDWGSQIQVKEAEDGERVEAGKALVAPGGFDMTVEEGERVKITSSERTASPVVNETMLSVAKVYTGNCIGVVLTGMGNDGTEGLKMIKRRGGCTLAEDESTCVVYGMPRAAINEGVVDRVVPLPQMAEEIMKEIEK